MAWRDSSRAAKRNGLFPKLLLGARAGVHRRLRPAAVVQRAGFDVMRAELQLGKRGGGGGRGEQLLAVERGLVVLPGHVVVPVLLTILQTHLLAVS
eukprot:CAMPEP_0113246468 /NCGR_PEP_ID=MMETSP0008_2-20120614/9480_1 /TAXON_ID=97485 /ORGANISM="Prymnesium parvum" /LENGTH=95 /DNA_ID=CAMNT_0000094213 /DNA_START=374 /DNA_END=662 /DNA_ORIENTATION=+ /assembly_acc=CAM_ASM_000153